MSDPILDNSVENTIYYFPVLMILLYMILIYNSYINVASQHFSNAYCDNKEALMEQETSRYALKGMTPTLFWILFTLLVLLFLYYALMFVLKILNQFNLLREFRVPINWITFLVVWMFIGLLVAFMFSNRSIPQMDYSLFNKNIDNIFTPNRDCNDYVFATQFDDLPVSLQQSILEKYRSYRERNNDTRFLDDDLRDELRQELGPGENGLRKNIHKYLNFSTDIQLINQEYGLWLERTSQQINADNDVSLEARNACSSKIQEGNKYIPLDLVNNSSEYMKNLKTLVTITWIFLAVTLYPIYSNNYLGTQIQKLSFILLILIGMALLYYFLVIRSE